MNFKSSEQNRPSDALSDRELSNVSGGKVRLSDILIVKTVDKSSPSLPH
jgi:hypothetical protein